MVNVTLLEEVVGASVVKRISQGAIARRAPVSRLKISLEHGERAQYRFYGRTVKPEDVSKPLVRRVRAARWT